MTEKRCETCRHWFDYQSPPPPYPTPWRTCNHPDPGGKGCAPLRLATDGCKKHEPAARGHVRRLGREITCN